MRSRGLIVAIDGPSGAGKSTVGRALARRLGYVFIDTGAMYRALALKALQLGVSLEAGDPLAEMAERTSIELLPGEGGVRLDGQTVTAEIRTQEVSAAASRISIHSPVRRQLVTRQREMGREGGVVMDGRDTGSVVFPDAELKVYLDADPSRRALRRCRELSAAGRPTDPAIIEQEVRARDRQDSTRADSPLVRADDAVHLDTTDLTPEDVLKQLLELVQDRLARDTGER